jgi:hypothetical protein
MDDGEIQVDSIEPIRRGDITPELARESGFGSVAELLTIAKHGSGRNVYLIRFRYIPPGGWLRPGAAPGERRSTAPPSVGVRKARSTGGASEGPGDS